jgi:hypothetical protein
MLALSTMLVAASAANADIRPLLRHQGFDAPLNGRETIKYVGHIRQSRNDYQVYLYHGVFLPHSGGVDHGLNRLIVVLNGSTFVGAYDTSMPAKCRVRGQKVICNTEHPSVVEFTKRGPPDKILFDGYAQRITYGSKLKACRRNEHSCGRLKN